MTIKDAIIKFESYRNRYSQIMDVNAASNILNSVINELDSDSNVDIGSKYFYLNRIEMSLEGIFKDIVFSYTRDKDKVIKLFKSLLSFIYEYANVKLNIEFPKINISNTFERLMYEAKEIQDGKKSKEDLVDELWVSDRTIDKDIQALKGEDPENSISILGNKFKIEDLSSNRRKFSSPSTVHPIFLTSNLTQVFIMLRGLYKMSLGKSNYSYATLQAKEIYRQLSKYAKERIEICLNELFDISEHELAWFKTISNCSDESFFSEKRCSIFNKDVLLESLKNRKNCFIEDINHNIYKNVKVCELMSNSSFLLKDMNGTEYVIKEEDILKSSLSLEGLI